MIVKVYEKRRGKGKSIRKQRRGGRMEGKRTALTMEERDEKKSDERRWRERRETEGET